MTVWRIVRAEAGMRKSIDRMELVHDFLKRAFSGSLHAKRILSLANGTLGVLTGASLAVSVIGHALAQARGLMDRHAIKQVDRLLSNAGVVVWDLFAPWAREVVGQRKAIVVAMDWTDFSDREDSRRWLDAIKPAKRRREVAVAMAARAALRVTPLLSLGLGKPGPRATVLSDWVLPSLRATALQWAAAKYPAHGSELRASAASATSAAHAAAASADAAANTAASAASADDYVLGSTDRYVLGSAANTASASAALADAAALAADAAHLYLSTDAASASDYPPHGGFLDIYGLMFNIGGGRVVDFWSNGISEAGALGFRAPRQQGVARRQILEIIEADAAQARRTGILHHQEIAGAAAPMAFPLRRSVAGQPLGPGRGLPFRQGAHASSRKAPATPSACDTTPRLRRFRFG